MPEPRRSGSSFVAAWRAALRERGLEDPGLWEPVVRAGPDPARMYDELVAALVRVDRGDLVEALGPRPTPLAPVRAGRPRRRWIAAAALSLAVTAVLLVAPRRLRSTETRSDALYFVLVDRFADGDPDPAGSIDRSDPQGWHGGDLAGVLQHLDAIADLGVGGIWLSPVGRARSEKHGPWGAYHGYWALAIDELDPRFGTMGELRTLADRLHRRGMSLYLDVVYNHVAPDAPLVAQHPDWFHHEGDIANWDDPVEAVTHDVHGLPDLAQEKPEVYAYLRDASLALIDAADPDGFRVDAVRHLPEGFLARLGEELRARKPGFRLLGEVFDGNADHLAARAKADHLDAVFDFPLYFALRDTVCDGAPAGRLATALLAGYGGATPVTLVDNHDLPRIASACGAKAETALAVALTARGTPSITYGTEAGLVGAKEPDNRADMDFTARSPLGDAVRTLLDLRARWPSLASGRTRVVGLSDDRLVVARVGADETTMVSLGAPASWEGLATPAETRSVGGVTLARSLGAPPIHAGPVRLELAVDAPPGARVVGAGPALGRWDPGAAVPVVDGVARIDVTDGDVLAFKLVTVADDGSVAWESGQDRFLLVTSDRWTGGDACGTRCAPVVDGVARASAAWPVR
jgi:glycosidase